MLLHRVNGLEKSQIGDSNSPGGIMRIPHPERDLAPGGEFFENISTMGDEGDRSG